MNSPLPLWLAGNVAEGGGERHWLGCHGQSVAKLVRVSALFPVVGEGHPHLDGLPLLAGW